LQKRHVSVTGFSQVFVAAASVFDPNRRHENVSFVHHDKLLTSAGGAKSYDVSLYLVHHLYGDKVAKGVGRGLVIDWDVNDYEFIKVD